MTRVSCQGVHDFSGDGRGGGNFYSGGNSVFGEKATS